MKTRIMKLFLYFKPHQPCHAMPYITFIYSTLQLLMTPPVRQTFKCYSKSRPLYILKLQSSCPDSAHAVSAARTQDGCKSTPSIRERCQTPPCRLGQAETNITAVRRVRYPFFTPRCRNAVPAPTSCTDRPSNRTPPYTPSCPTSRACPAIPSRGTETRRRRRRGRRRGPSPAPRTASWCIWPTRPGRGGAGAS